MPATLDELLEDMPTSQYQVHHHQRGTTCTNFSENCPSEDIDLHFEEKRLDNHPPKISVHHKTSPTKCTSNNEHNFCETRSILSHHVAPSGSIRTGSFVYFVRMSRTNINNDNE
jgi:hypothetical protein